MFFLFSTYQLLFFPLYSNKGGAQCKRAFKKGEEVRPYDMPGPAEEMEKNQKILLWLMEGQKEMVQHKRSPYGSVMTVVVSRLMKAFPFQHSSKSKQSETS